MTETTSSITARLRLRLETAQHRARAVPVSMRAAVDRMFERMREALDLPSRSELQELTQRLEDLDRRIAALASERVSEMARVVPALTERAGEAPELDVASTSSGSSGETSGESSAESIGESSGEPEAADADGDADGDADAVTASDRKTAVEADPAPRAGKRNKRNGRHQKK